MANHGTLGEFEPAKEDWTSYVERLRQYFAANDIAAAAKQRAILLSSCGAATYRQIKDVLSPTAPAEVAFDALVTALTTHFQPPPSEIMQRYRFNTRVRRPHESVSAYLAQLKQLAEHCKYGDTLHQMLRDRLVCGIAEQRWQKRLLSEEGLTYDKAMKILLSLESADQEVKDMHAAEPKLAVHHVRRQRGRHQGQRSPHGQPSTRSAKFSCYRCGNSEHKPAECPFKEAECHFCHRTGHIAKVCRSKLKQRSAFKASTKTTNAVSETDQLDTNEYEMYHLHAKKSRPFIVELSVSGSVLEMEVDTGATRSIISKTTYEGLWCTDEAPLLQPSQARLKTYTGEEINVAGGIKVEVVYQKQKAILPLLVVAGEGPSLLGRDWLQHIRFDWSCVNSVSTADAAAQEVCDRHPDLFKEELGELNGTTAKIYIDSDARPRFCHARQVPYALKEKVDTEIERLVNAGVLEPIQFSEWATPVVPVLKHDGTVRLCGDYKLTVNQVAKTDTYPLPRIEDLFASLTGGRVFSKIDLAQAYLQVPLDEESKKLVVINTHKGLYRFNRLPFGVSAAPSIFQRTMENLLQGLPGVCVYLDDILVSGGSTEEHLRNLEAVFTRLEQAGLRVKRSKCSFMLSSVEYLGFRISAEGLQPTTEKVRAVHSAPAPENVTQLKSFLGLINYYGKFLPDLSEVLAPMYRLLQKETTWSWGQAQTKAFQKVKAMLTSDCVLVHYDPTKELLLACDASPYGVGAVLSHRFQDGQERPIAFASRSLAPAEKRYSQLEKEGLAIIFGIKKFHMYLFGRRFEIWSDHKPLQHLFQATKATSVMASARLQ